MQKWCPSKAMRSFYSWWEVTKLALRFKWRCMVIRIFANRAIKRWKADNSEWSNDLKHRYKQKKKDLKADLKLRYRQLKKEFKAKIKGGYLQAESYPNNATGLTPGALRAGRLAQLPDLLRSPAGRNGRWILRRSVVRTRPSPHVLPRSRGR